MGNGIEDDAQVLAQRVASGEFGSPPPGPTVIGVGLVDPVQAIAQAFAKPGTPSYLNGWSSPAMLLGMALRGRGGGGGGYTPLVITYSGSSWDKSAAQVAAARPAASSVTWAGTTVLPRPVDGLAEGDTVTGTFAQPAPSAPLAQLSIPTWCVPSKIDNDQSGTDAVHLNEYLGLTYTVDGATYTKGDITTGGKATVPVTVNAAKPARFRLIDPSSFVLNFDTTNTWVTIPAGSAPIGNDGVGTTGDTITITSVAGVTWTVDGVDYPSSTFTGTKVVPYTKGTSTTVTAKGSPGYAFKAGDVTSWPLSFTDTTTAVVASADFSNYSNGTNFNDPATWNSNAYAGGTAYTNQPAKYCTINNGAMQIKTAGSYFGMKTGLTAAPNNLTIEFNCKLSNGDMYLCPPQDGNANGQGIRIAGGFYFGAGKRQNYTYSAGSYASGASKVVTPTDRLKVVINKAAATTTGYINGVQQFVVANTTMPAGWIGDWLYFECTSGPIEVANIVVSTS